MTNESLTIDLSQDWTLYDLNTAKDELRGDPFAPAPEGALILPAINRVEQAAQTHLEDEVKKIPSIKMTQKVQSNGIWAIIPKNKIEQLQKEYFFWVWDEHTGEVRWLCSFDTTEDDIKGFVSLLKEQLDESHL